MSLRKIIDTALVSKQGTMQGTIASDWYETYDSSGNWCWACDVDIGVDMPTVDASGTTTTTTILEAVPVASNNKEILYAEIGKGVTLSIMNNNKWSITGLSKVVNSTRHYIYVAFVDDIVTIVGEEMIGQNTRRLTYGELATLGGYGLIPYGAFGRFDASGNLIKLIWG